MVGDLGLEELVFLLQLLQASPVDAGGLLVFLRLGIFFLRAMNTPLPIGRLLAGPVQRLGHKATSRVRIIRRLLKNGPEHCRVRGHADMRYYTNCACCLAAPHSEWSGLLFS